MDKTELPDRAWIAITALAASWCDRKSTPADYLAALGRAIVMYQAARGIAAQEYEFIYEGVHVLTLVPGHDLGFAFTDP